MNTDEAKIEVLNSYNGGLYVLYNDCESLIERSFLFLADKNTARLSEGSDVYERSCDYQKISEFFDSSIFWKLSDFHNASVFGCYTYLIFYKNTKGSIKQLSIINPCWGDGYDIEQLVAFIDHEVFGRCNTLDAKIDCPNCNEYLDMKVFCYFGKLQRASLSIGGDVEWLDSQNFFFGGMPQLDRLVPFDCLAFCPRCNLALEVVVIIEGGRIARIGKVRTKIERGPSYKT